jgi:hypothetical protein
VSQWDEYEPFDRNGLTRWTDVFSCDEDGCDKMVAVYDPYGTCALVLCAEHSGFGRAGAGPIDYPPGCEGDDKDDDLQLEDYEEDDDWCDDDREIIEAPSLEDRWWVRQLRASRQAKTLEFFSRQT